MSRAAIQPFFILGNPRSGTSLFRLMLNRHSRIVVPPECGYILWYRDKYTGKLFDQNSALIDEFVKDVFRAKKFETWNLSFDELKNFVSANCPKSYSEACALVHQFYAESQGKKVSVWGDKNNYYVSICEKLLSLYPNAKYLCLIRDPRDVFASYLDLANLKTDSPYAPKLTVSVEDFSAEWIESLGKLDRLAEAVGEKAILFIRYEDLVEEPDKTLSDVVAFLGENFEEGLADPSTSTHRINREPEATLDWKPLTREPPQSSRVGRYRHRLMPQDIAEIEEKCDQALQRFGYTVNA